MPISSLDGPLWRLCAADAARLSRKTGRAVTLWAPRRDDPNQDCVVVWDTITKDQQAPWSATMGYMACEGVKQVLVESEGPQQSIPDIGQDWPADEIKGTDSQTAVRYIVCIFVFRNMTCSPGQLVKQMVPRECPRALQVRMPKWEARPGWSLTAGYDRPDVEMFQNTPLFPSVSGEEVVERSSEDAVE